MKLSPNQRDKLDPKLLEAFLLANPADRMTAVLFLKVKDPDFRAAPRISRFRNYAEWRKALDEWRREDLEKQIGPTIRAIRDLGLKVQSEELTRLLVVRGTAENILKASASEGVRRVICDHPIGPFSPR